MPAVALLAGGLSRQFPMNLNYTAYKAIQLNYNDPLIGLNLDTDSDKRKGQMDCVLSHSAPLHDLEDTNKMTP